MSARWPRFSVYRRVIKNEAGRLRDRPSNSKPEGCLPAAAAAPAPVTATAAEAPVTAAAAPAPVTARTPAPMLHGGDRAGLGRAMADRGAVDHGRSASGCLTGNTDAAGNHNRQQSSTHS